MQIAGPHCWGLADPEIILKHDDFWIITAKQELTKFHKEQTNQVETVKHLFPLTFIYSVKDNLFYTITGRLVERDLKLKKLYQCIKKGA